MSTDKQPIEGKVYAATVGAGAGATVSAAILWLLGVLVWGVPDTAARAADAISAVPAPLNAIIVLGVTVGTTFVAGYSTKHTPRPQPTTDGAVIVEPPPAQAAETVTYDGYGAPIVADSDASVSATMGQP